MVKTGSAFIAGSVGSIPGQEMCKPHGVTKKKQTKKFSKRKVLFKKNLKYDNRNEKSQKIKLKKEDS